MARRWYPDRDDVDILAVSLAEELFEDYNSSALAFSLLGGAQGAALLESALAAPRQTFDGRPLYRTMFDKAAVLMRSIIKNHPFVDGNKRIAICTTALFLFMNGRLLFVPPRQLVDYALAIAREDSTLDWPQISAWLKPRCPYSADVSRYTRQKLALDFGFTMTQVFRLASNPEMADLLKAAYGHV